jgi:hypothetical protein
MHCPHAEQIRTFVRVPLNFYKELLRTRSRRIEKLYLFQGICLEVEISVAQKMHKTAPPLNIIIVQIAGCYVIIPFSTL